MYVPDWFKVHYYHDTVQDRIGQIWHLTACGRRIIPQQRVTQNPSDVTCKQCLRSLAKAKGIPPP
jgi:hypothetical protein